MPYDPYARKPRALTPKVQEIILRVIANGGFRNRALAEAGISLTTFDYWRKKVEARAPDAEEFINFYESFERACAKAENDAVGAIYRSQDGWQGPAWWLARRHPRRWSEKARAAATQAPLDPTTPTDEDGNKA